MYVCVYIYVYMYVYVYVYVCMYMHYFVKLPSFVHLPAPGVRVYIFRLPVYVYSRLFVCMHVYALFGGIPPVHPSS